MAQIANRMSQIRRPLYRDLMPEERATYIRWRRAVIAFYGCLALITGVVAIGTAESRSIRVVTVPAAVGAISAATSASKQTP